MHDARPVDLSVLRRRYAEVRAMQKAVRGLLRSLSIEQLRKPLWPSGRNLWESALWWLSYRRPFLNLVEGISHAESGIINASRGFTMEEASSEWDATDARADGFMESFTAARWNTDIDFWADRKKSRRMKAWELFLTQFANRLDGDWIMVLEDICTMGYEKELEQLIGDDWPFFREGERLSDYHPNQNDPE